MKKFIFIFICYTICISTLTAQDFDVRNTIILDSTNKKLAPLIAFENEEDVRSMFDRGIVVGFSDKENNSTKLGKFVEIEYEMGFAFENTFISQGKFSIVFSNLNSVKVTKGENISNGTIIGTTKKGDKEPLRTFVLSKDEKLVFLKKWTEDGKIYYKGNWYWNPMFLFR
ncbi:MAG: hypothetical protein Ta2F_16680 [Termitinemataceae bacterium]|nr:MAG: hypothetical protein Ta2F_16680 [Termitinemataceae bacterium]